MIDGSDGGAGLSFGRDYGMDRRSLRNVLLELSVAGLEILQVRKLDVLLDRGGNDAM